MTESQSFQNSSDAIVGIDLGTTNSLLAVYRNHKVEVVDIDGDPLLPSYVGLSPDNELLVGHPARNQYILYPERTIKSIKRRMGGTERVSLGERSLLPEEVSALILGRLKDKAEAILGMPIRRAVITVPAYFNDTQRQVTRAAGEIAGMEVLRIVNEPTAASLTFRNSVLPPQDGKSDISVVYDLGGGTFDVSIVREEGDLTEVLASRGDTRLGGDDFDRLILDHFLAHIQREYRIDLKENRRAVNRLMHAAEAAKIALSNNSYVNVIEENIAEANGNPIHLELELTRNQYEDMIHSLVERTLDCVQQALHDTELSPSQVNNVLLVGGSSRTPLVRERLRKYFSIEPRSEIHPDLCVAMGAALLAARIQGVDIERVLVDITPHSFGIKALDFDKVLFRDCLVFAPIIPRNTPLPVTRSESFFTSYDDQDIVSIEVYQGENQDLLQNTQIGHFRVEGLSKAPAGNTVIGRMSLDLNGILTVTAIEKKTGLQKTITIEGANRPKNAEDIANSKRQISDLLEREDFSSNDVQLEPSKEDELLPEEHQSLLERAKNSLEKMHPDDRQEAEELIAQIEQLSLQNESYDEPLNELQELLYFIGA